MRAILSAGLEILKVQREDVVIREISPGDSTAATDFVDFDQLTAAVAGQEHWMWDAADLTAGDLSNVMTVTQTINDDTVLGIYGFLDLSPSAELTAIRLRKGQEIKDWWQVEPCYGMAPYGGIAMDENGKVTPSIWKPNEPFGIDLNVTGAATDQPIVFLGFVVERTGTHITVKQQ
jgi:hypothetical protein